MRFSPSATKPRAIERAVRSTGLFLAFGLFACRPANAPPDGTYWCTSGANGTEYSTTPYSSWVRLSASGDDWENWISMSSLPSALDGICLDVTPDGTIAPDSGVFERGRFVRTLTPEETEAAAKNIPGRPVLEVIVDGSWTTQTFFYHSMSLCRIRRHGGGGRYHDDVFDKTGRLRSEGSTDFDRRVGRWTFFSEDGRTITSGVIGQRAEVRDAVTGLPVPDAKESPIITAEFINAMERSIFGR